MDFLGHRGGHLPPLLPPYLYRRHVRDPSLLFALKSTFLPSFLPSFCRVVSSSFFPGVGGPSPGPSGSRGDADRGRGSDSETLSWMLRGTPVWSAV